MTPYRYNRASASRRDKTISDFFGRRFVTCPEAYKDPNASGFLWLVPEPKLSMQVPSRNEDPKRSAEIAQMPHTETLEHRRMEKKNR